MNKIRDTKQWTSIINPVSGWFDIHLSSLWSYRDLVLLFVRRDFLAVYKQTILGPIWYLLQPLFTTLVFTVIFGKIARLPTDGLPPMIFYMSGIVAWRYFTDCLTKTSNTFAGNASIFGKVWFPRLAVPISVVISNLISFGIQFILFLGFWVYFIMNGAAISPKPLILLMPLFIIQMGALGLGFGIIASSLTTKYRDLAQLIGFGVQLWMYATPVIYPISMVPGKWQWLIALNPMAPIIEGFRYAFLGSGTIHPWQIGLSLGTTIVILAIGIILFSRIEKDFMDTV
jgi:lipopolysaccharide transport system permease protein